MIKGEVDLERKIHIKQFDLNGNCCTTATCVSYVSQSLKFKLVTRKLRDLIITYRTTLLLTMIIIIRMCQSYKEEYEKSVIKIFIYCEAIIVSTFSVQKITNMLETHHLSSEITRIKCIVVWYYSCFISKVQGLKNLRVCSVWSHQ